MQKRLITMLLLVVWLCQLSGRYVVMLDFFINQDYISKNLCVNRDKPELHCNGKCHLAKKLKEEERKDQENPERKLENKSELFCERIVVNTLLQPVLSLPGIRHQYPLSIGCPIDQPSSVFHPPTV
ncbi:hypothetical protein J2T02_004824 [Chitinophaga terrae (ex Kim and Jung 2007)]|uniref:hypothetical protein n=1 Tax=Chitinophaga terrae (ex Kim and Jung 2007) TaxID=408074 RepID=UPI002780F184|nr:hypothetical protein [Chitinophaga terrae (ex Kim and Jung 2007)]MDQ0109680.1 hypothetical protein [Chitinophaga terrae (ex Kim and Jung 2007)]